MADPPAAEQIRAAGAVLWRPADPGAEVAVIHRIRYDDWSFPKGKREPGEHLLATAVREVAEETGIRVILGRRLSPARYQKDHRPKRVDYWVARAAADGTPFRANDEVDLMEWLPVGAARIRLSYSHDAELLAEFEAGPAETVPLVLLRHASAGRRGDGPADDMRRPLDARGVADAARLARLLSCFGRCRVLSSAAERCVATVRPYAALAGAEVQVEPAFMLENPAAEPGPAARAMAAVIGDGLPAVVCAHRENLPVLLAAACRRLGAAVPDGPALGKGSFWVLQTAAGALAGAERHDPRA
jgi:8-oxo-(d)GTP phosphatase